MARLTVTPGDGDTLEENQEEERHAAGRVIIKEFKDVKTALK